MLLAFVLSSPLWIPFILTLLIIYGTKVSVSRQGWCEMMVGLFLGGGLIVFVWLIFFGVMYFVR